MTYSAAQGPIADALAVRVYQDLKWRLIAPLEEERWELPADKVRAVIAYLAESLGVEAFRSIAEDVALKNLREKQFSEEPPEDYECDYDQAYKTLGDNALTDIQELLVSRLGLKLELLTAEEQRREPFPNYPYPQSIEDLKPLFGINSRRIRR